MLHLLATFFSVKVDVQNSEEPNKKEVSMPEQENVALNKTYTAHDLTLENCLYCCVIPVQMCHWCTL